MLLERGSVVLGSGSITAKVRVRLAVTGSTSPVEWEHLVFRLVA